MNIADTLRKIALPLLVAFGVLYLFGMRSTVTTIALLTISLSVLYFAMSSMLGGARAMNEALDASEHKHGHAGWNFRVFVDEQNQIWLRAGDLKRYLDYDKSDAWLARRYPSRYGKVHPQIDAWYMHPDALRDFMGNSGKESTQRFISWVNREVLGMHRFERAMATPNVSTRQSSPAIQRNFLLAWFIKHWRGEAGLMLAVFGGGAVVACASFAVHLFKTPVDITLHYRWSTLLYVAQIAVVSGGMYWWGRGVLHSTQRWIAGDRSLLAALLATLLGFGGVFYGLSTVVDTEKQYFLTDFFTIIFDADPKPEVRYDANASRIMLYGQLGFGTTNRVREMLINNPQATSIELKSYGGRAAEGFGLLVLIVEHKLETYVRAECMSACVYAYVGGWQRHVASSAQFGLHRSGYSWQAGGNRLNGTDQAFADFMRGIGVDEAFIARGLKPSIHDIYAPTPSEALAAQLATAEWI
jgi:hypothetical protein